MLANVDIVIFSKHFHNANNFIVILNDTLCSMYLKLTTATE